MFFSGISSVHRLFNKRFKKVLDIYLNKDFSKAITNEDKKVILLGFLGEVEICYKIAFRKILCGKDYKYLEQYNSRLVDEKYDVIDKNVRLEGENYYLKSLLEDNGIKY